MEFLSLSRRRFSACEEKRLFSQASIKKECSAQPGNEVGNVIHLVSGVKVSWSPLARSLTREMTHLILGQKQKRPPKLRECVGCRLYDFV